LHVFTYSERANTHAIQLEGVVPANERAERSKLLHILSDKKKRVFYEQHLGDHRPVLFESEQDGELMYGFSDNYIKVQTNYNPTLVNKTVHVKIENISDSGICNVDLPEIEVINHI
jgi:threonylcarbamoyladenosine tRNA methylthiotransferase MtaB